MVCALAAFSIFAANTAHASVFSFISDIFNQGKTEASVIEYNSQKLPILAAVAASSLSVGGGDVEIVDEIALVSQDSSSDGDVFQPNNGEISVYVVRAGDTLSQIANMYDVSVNTIKWANNLEKNVISEGQTLAILPVSGVSHTVKAGDTVASLAKKYSADAGEIIQFNDLDGSNPKLAVGSKIIVPDATISAPASSSGSSSGSSSAIKKFASLPAYEGYYTKPVAGARKTQGIHGYNGIDLGAPIGTPVLAAASGKVIISKDAGYNGGYGNYIVVYHTNGTQTLYAHLSRNAVAQNTDVTKGQVIGYVGSTGKSTGPHLHFEVRGAKNPF
ncbi:MAG: peptidoglycan DD-metalloendopeptidase family protein [Patescibacteria group bacterium]